MILFKTENVKPILEETKTATIRTTRKKVKPGSTHQARLNFKTAPFAYLKIISVEPVNMEQLKKEDLHRLGYQNRQEYLEKQKNWNGTAPRQIIKFKLIGVKKNDIKL